MIRYIIVIEDIVYHSAGNIVAKRLTSLTNVCRKGINDYLCNMDVTEIIDSIKCTYERECMTVGELMEILIKCGFSQHECREIIRCGINNKEMGRTSYRNLGRKMLNRNTVVVLKRKKN